MHLTPRHLIPHPTLQPTSTHLQLRSTHQIIHLWKVKVIEKVTDDVPMYKQTTYHNLLLFDFPTSCNHKRWPSAQKRSPENNAQKNFLFSEMTLKTENDYPMNLFAFCMFTNGIASIVCSNNIDVYYYRGIFTAVRSLFYSFVTKL